MSPRAGLVINPWAWANARWPDRRRALARAFAPLGEVVETEDAAALPAIFRRWQGEGRDLVAVCGGDGTVHAALNALVGAWGPTLPRLLLLHGGTFGVTTRGCGTTPVRLVEALAAGAPVRTRRVEPLCVGDRFAFTFGLGLFADLPAEFVRRGARGPGAVRALGATTIASALVGGRLAARMLRGWEGIARCDGRPRGAGHLAGLYAAALDTRLPLPALWGAPRPAGHVRVLTVDAWPGALRTGLVALGRPDAAVHLDTVRVVEVNPSRPAFYMVDGELAPLDGALRISTGPVLEVVVVA